MMFPGLTYLYQANFPKSQYNKLGNVYYTVYNADGSVYLSRTNADVKKLGDGSFGVSLSFGGQGRYSIWWDIDGTPYVASEEINVISGVPITTDFYSGYAL